MKLAFLIATTQMLSRLKQTIIATLGVTFGIGMFVFMISFMTGVNKVLEDTMLSATPHIRIFKKIEASKQSIVDDIKSDVSDFNVVHHQKVKDEKLNLKDGMLIVDNIRKDPDVFGVSPLVTSQVFYNFGPIQINGLLYGVQIMEEDKLFDLKSKMKQGKLENLLSLQNGIIMGEGLAKKMNMQLGDKVYISTPRGNTILLQVVGIFKYGVGAIDDARSYANMSTVQKVLQKDSRYITEINIKIKDHYQAHSIYKRFEQKYGYNTEDWETANATILFSFTLRNIITYTVSITLLIVAGFGIYNIMNMTIYEKMRDIAILKAIGFAGGDVMTIFMIQALTIGTMGALSGLTLGFLLSWWVSTIPFDTGGILSVDTFPVNFDPTYYMIGIIFGVLTTALAGYLPSRKAAKIDPVQIIRGS
jgi:lipoprotein-releasing system permease protein